MIGSLHIYKSCKRFIKQFSFSSCCYHQCSKALTSSVPFKHLVGRITCAQLVISRFPAAHEGITSFQRSRRVNLFTHTQRDARTHTSGVKCESLSGCFTITLLLLLVSLLCGFNGRNLFIFPSKCWQLCLRSGHQSQVCCCRGEKDHNRGEEVISVGHLNITGSCETKRI